MEDLPLNRMCGVMESYCSRSLRKDGSHTKVGSGISTCQVYGSPMSFTLFTCPIFAGIRPQIKVLVSES